MSYELFHEQLRYTKAPYSHEYIPDRPEGTRWRIRDANDDAAGMASTKEEADKAVDFLNNRYGTQWGG